MIRTSVVKVCEARGLEIRNLASNNVAFLSKVAITVLLEPDSLLQSIILSMGINLMIGT